MDTFPYSPYPIGVIGNEFIPRSRNKLGSSFYQIIYPTSPMTKSEIQEEFRKDALKKARQKARR